MISVLLPSRGRPHNVQRLYNSLKSTTIGKWEMVVRLDTDDPSRDEYPNHPEIMYVLGVRITLSQYWNECAEKASGDILMQCGDDIIFRTPGWDIPVKNEFEKYPDRIVLVFGDDGDPNKGKNFGTHPFVHRNWVNTLGYFVPPYFSSDFTDTWLNDLADRIGRKVQVPILTEHMHPAFKKAELDQTYNERIERHFKEDMPGLYDLKETERQMDAQQLRKAMQ